MAKFPPTSRFSYGFKRMPVIADFAVVIVLLILSANFMSTSIGSLLHPPENVKNPPVFLLVLSIAGIVSTIWGSFVIGGLNLRTCSFGGSGKALSIISDLFTSITAFISTVIKMKFHVESIDPFVSLLISCVIFGMAVNELRDVLSVLGQMCPDKVSIGAILRTIGVRSGDDKGHIWMLNGDDAVVTMKCKEERVLRELSGCAEQFGIADWTVELEVGDGNQN
jgi:cation diffusion facilitator family transporter